MLRKRPSFFSSGSKSTPKPTPKRTPAPSPKPGRTLVMLSTSSTAELDNIAEERFTFDFEKPKTIDEVNSQEPLFFDFFLPASPGELPRRPQLPPQIPEEDEIEPLTPSDVPSLRSSMDDDDDSVDMDDILDSYCSTPPQTGLVARCISIVYSGRPKVVNMPRPSISLRRPDLQPLQTRSGHTSRTSSVSTRNDLPQSPGRFSDDGSKSSPASSISEYSNLTGDTIPEGSPLSAKQHTGVDMKPFRRLHRRNASSTTSDSSYTNELNPSPSDLWGNGPTADFGKFELTPPSFKRQAHYFKS